jgi:hypothetical protein
MDQSLVKIDNKALSEYEKRYRRIQVASAISFTNLKNKFLGSSKSKVNLGLRECKLNCVKSTGLVFLT